MRRMQTAVGAATATQSDPLDKVAAAIGAYLDFLGRASSAADQYALNSDDRDAWNPHAP